MPDIATISPSYAMETGGQQVSAGMQVTMDKSASGKKVLGRLRRLDSLHLAFSMVCWSMWVLSVLAQVTALAPRHGWTKMSSTTPSWSSARQEECRTPCVRMNASSRYHLSPLRVWPSVQAGNALAEFLAPTPDGLMADGDSPRRRQKLDILKAEPEYMYSQTARRMISVGNRCR
jgi:hypothetical protein